MKNVFTLSLLLACTICFAPIIKVFAQTGSDCRTLLLLEMENKADSIYLTENNQLVPLGRFTASNNYRSLITASPRKNTYTITIETDTFDAASHKLRIMDTLLVNGHLEFNCPDTIDGYTAYGIDCTIPRTEING